jgi:cell division protein FtsB
VQRGRVFARRRALAAVTVTVLLAGVLVFAVFPTRTWLRQRDDTARVSAELAEVRAERAEVEAARDRLLTREEIERRAKEEHGMVNPGEESYSILPAPGEPIGLPEGWPFAGVERALGTG